MFWPIVLLIFGVLLALSGLSKGNRRFTRTTTPLPKQPGKRTQNVRSNRPLTGQAARLADWEVLYAKSDPHGLHELWFEYVKKRFLAERPESATASSPVPRLPKQGRLWRCVGYHDGHLEVAVRLPAGSRRSLNLDLMVLGWVSALEAGEVDNRRLTRIRAVFRHREGTEKLATRDWSEALELVYFGTDGEYRLV